MREAVRNGHLSGRGPFDRRCTAWLADRTAAGLALLTASGTSALEMAVLLAGVGPGDEVIMPSFTFVSTANAVVLRGATPVFVDVRPDTLNLDERLVGDAITGRTRAVLPIHYAGVGAELDSLSRLCAEHGLTLIEDAAQGLMAGYRDRPLGSVGQLGCISFHETKNLHCGEGGALLVNDAALAARAEVMQEKGTDRTAFLRGEVDKYTWVDVGSSFLTSEINSAFLWAQLEAADQITERRRAVWDAFHEQLAGLEAKGVARRPVVPDHCLHNGHTYYLLLEDRQRRDSLIDGLARRGIQAVFHYVPLHSSPEGARSGRAASSMEHTDSASERLVRLPLWPDLREEDVARIVGAVLEEAG